MDPLLREIELVRLLQGVTAACNEATSVEQAVQSVVDHICGFTGWSLEHVYFSPQNSVAGTADPNFPRAHTTLAGKNCYLLPVVVGSEVVAGLEFLSDKPVQPEGQLLETMRHIGQQLGKVFERDRVLKTYRQLVESVNAIVWRADTRFQPNFVSKEAETILGYPVEEWVREPAFWTEHIHPEDREWVISFCAQSISERRPFDFEYRMIAKEGRVLWFQNFVRVISENDEQPGDLIGVMIDITRQKNAEEQLSKSHDQLRALTAHLQSVREDERIKIARDLHDELGQVLAALKMDLALLNQRLGSSAKVPRPKLVREIASMCGMVDRTIQAVRRIITELRPAVLDHLDFNDAIEWQTQEFQSRAGIACEFHSNLRSIKLERTTATILFRIFQETITNVQWHSKASHVRIALEEKDGRLNLEVHDNGRGITEGEISEAKSFGILGIRERALLLGGEVHIFGAPGQGTTVRVQVPLVQRESHER